MSILSIFKKNETCIICGRRSKFVLCNVCTHKAKKRDRAKKWKDKGVKDVDMA
jgi:hypothetical protein